jgi:hypothetical protein
MMNSQYA